MTEQHPVRGSLWAWSGCALLAAVAALAIRAPRPWVEIARPQPLGDVFAQARRSPFRPWNHTDRDWSDRLRRVSPVEETAARPRSVGLSVPASEAVPPQDAAAELPGAPLEPSSPAPSGEAKRAIPAVEVAASRAGADAQAASVQGVAQQHAPAFEAADLPPTPPTFDPAEAASPAVPTATTPGAWTTLKPVADAGEIPSGPKVALASSRDAARARETSGRDAATAPSLPASAEPLHGKAFAAEQAAPLSGGALSGGALPAVAAHPAVALAAGPAFVAAPPKGEAAPKKEEAPPVAGSPAAAPPVAFQAAPAPVAPKPAESGLVAPQFKAAPAVKTPAPKAEIAAPLEPAAPVAASPVLELPAAPASAAASVVVAPPGAPRRVGKESSTTLVGGSLREPSAKPSKASIAPLEPASPLEPDAPALLSSAASATPLEPGLPSVAATSDPAERANDSAPRRGSWDERTERLRIDVSDRSDSLRRRPASLAARLEKLAGRGECAAWASETLASLERLVQCPADADPSVEAELKALRAQWAAVDRLLPRGTAYETEVEWRQTRYALQRWLDVRAAAFGLARAGKLAFAPPRAFQLTAHRGTAPLAADAAPEVWNLPLVIGQVERFEWERDSEAAEFLAVASDAFVRSPDPAWQALGEQLRLHYRNHNVRVAVHKDFVNRFVPQQQAEPGQVCEEIQGVPVRGRSVTQTRVSLDFLPARDQLAFALLVDGSVDSWTRAEATGAQFSNFGRARFLARVPMVVSPAGPAFGEPHVDVQAQQFLRGFTTMADDLPLMNTLVRSFAKSRYDSEQETALAEMRSRIGARVRRRIQETLVEQRGGKADTLRNQVLSTLESLALRPTEADMQTTSDRLTLRTRLAAPVHLAAWTPRPEAPAGSVASMQVHESLVNNFLAQLGLSGRRIQMKQLPTELAKRFHLQVKVNGDEIPEDLYWSFAARDGVRVELLDEKLDVHLRFDEVEHKEQIAGAMTVSVSYRPMLTEEGVQFVRDGGVRVHAAGESFKTKWYFRALFTKVFPKGKEITVVPAKLLADPRLAGWGVTQIALRDGWFGVAIGPRVSGPAAPAPQTVLLPASYGK